MEKRRRVEATNVEFPLPEAMIVDIQSYLSAKEAARTTVLSQSWRSAWSTRPILHFDSRNHPNKHEFWAFTKKTMQRYERLNLKIQSFRLSIDEWDMKDTKIAEELIAKAMSMGTVDFNFVILSHSCDFILPREVLESKNLIRLSVFGCRIDLGEGERVNCLGLISLSLENVKIVKNELIWNIISRCPLIEKFMLQEMWLQDFGSVVDGPINMYQLNKLKSLKLCCVDVDPQFFSGLLFKFPFLKDLSLENCGGYDYRGIKLFSHSLEYISFVQRRLLRVHCEFPRIRKFKFKGVKLPSLSFETVSREWESDISVRCSSATTKWFLELNKVLTSLSLSKITLSFDFRRIAGENLDLQVLPKEDLPKTMVEKLIINAPSTICCELMNCLFQSCLPKFIALDFPKSIKVEKWRRCHKNLAQCLGKRLLASSMTTFEDEDVFVLEDLIEEVNVQVLEESLAEWQPLSWVTFVDDLSTSKDMQTIRFQLRWQPKLSHYLHPKICQQLTSN